MTPGAVSAPESCTTGGAGAARGGGSIGAVVEVFTSPSTLSAGGRDTSHTARSPHLTSTDPRYEGKLPPGRGTRAPVA
ncbi:hypothetical protein GCM10010282_02710 [Streptomyces roseolus]|nr:hypothetical protein GCM10010282_02710 [Streptomyces roseolus]